MRTTIRRLLCVAVLAAVAAACGGSSGNGAAEPQGSQGSNTVSISGFLFKPDALTVPAGTTVTWTNTDDIAHTVTAGSPGMPSGAFDSGNKVKDETFAHTFSSTGSFAYFCNNHNGMLGEIAVT